MRPFEYIKVKSLSEAVERLTRYGEKAHLLAGGTDVVGKLKERELAPEILVDVKGIPGLSGIEYHPGEGVKIGPLTTIREIETSALILEHLPVLAYAAHLLGQCRYGIERRSEETCVLPCLQRKRDRIFNHFTWQAN